MDLLCRTALWMCMTAVVPCAAQTHRFSGTVRAGKTYRHSIGRGLLFVATTDEMRIRRVAEVGEDDNFAGCVNPPVIGPKNFELQPMDFDPARGRAAMGKRRSFHFVLNAADEEAECAELRRVIDPDTAVDNEWHSHPMGRATVTLSQVKLSGPPSKQATVVETFQFSAVVRLPHPKHRL